MIRKFVTVPGFGVVLALRFWREPQPCVPSKLQRNQHLTHRLNRAAGPVNFQTVQQPGSDDRRRLDAQAQGEGPRTTRTGLLTWAAVAA